MTWQAQTMEEQRMEFVHLAETEGVPIRELCRRFGVSAKTGYKWLARAEQGGEDWMVDRSRRPQTSPRRTDAEMEARIVALRQQHPSWGGRKLQAWLKRDGVLGVPSPSTITAILTRSELIDPQATEQRQHPVRFEYPAPNELWQLDFMGHLPLAEGRLHPLSLLDDHSRYCLGLWACANERRTTVQPWLQEAFVRYGLPLAILTDNGSPWGASGNRGVTTLEADLLQLGITVVHGRPYHPQTQGKVERFHRTVATELTNTRAFATLDEADRHFQGWRTVYNTERPHQALDGQVPADRYRPSPRPYPAQPPEPVYGPDDAVRLVRDHGYCSFRNRDWLIGRGIAGRRVGIRPTHIDGVFAVYFCHQQVATIDLRDPS